MFLIERKYDTTNEIKAIYRILIPALVFFIENIVELRPEANIFLDLKFKTRVEIDGSFQFTSLTIFSQVSRTVPGKQVAFKPKIFYDL